MFWSGLGSAGSVNILSLSITKLCRTQQVSTTLIVFSTSNCILVSTPHFAEPIPKAHSTTRLAQIFFLCGYVLGHCMVSYFLQGRMPHRPRWPLVVWALSCWEEASNQVFQSCLHVCNSPWPRITLTAICSNIHTYKLKFGVGQCKQYYRKIFLIVKVHGVLFQRLFYADMFPSNAPIQLGKFVLAQNLFITSCHKHSVWTGITLLCSYFYSIVLVSRATLATPIKKIVMQRCIRLTRCQKPKFKKIYITYTVFYKI